MLRTLRDQLLRCGRIDRRGIDERRAAGETGQQSVLALQHVANFVLRRQTGKDDVSRRRCFAWRCGNRRAGRAERSTLGGRAIPDRQRKTGGEDVFRHRQTHRAQAEKRHANLLIHHADPFVAFNSAIAV